MYDCFLFKGKGKATQLKKYFDKILAISAGRFPGYS